IVEDMHAEATSEKMAMGWFLDGRVSAVGGTHTHVLTADAQVLPGGTAYITDVGMTGAHRSILGREIHAVLAHFVTGMPQRFELAEEDVRLSGALIAVQEETGTACAITTIHEPLASA
ncbi:MAG: YmdB family metallophosphoesterase, partial [bacterium]|nr:YmdB family metallophosphoesterase [bacterium]